jgi:hypothetical protein
MTPQECDIKWFSVSSVLKYQEAPKLWCLTYLYKFRDPGNAFMWRGTAVGRGVEVILRGRPKEEAEQFALTEFTKLTMGEITDEIEAEQALIGPMVRQASKWHAEAKWGPLAATEFKIENLRLPGVETPFIGFIDFTGMEEVVPDIELKTTKRCPSSAPNYNHLMQAALYNVSRGRPSTILYLTDKKYAAFSPSQDDMDAAVADLAKTARALERFIKVMPNIETAISSCPPPKPDHYMMNDAVRTKLAELEEVF